MRDNVLTLKESLIAEIRRGIVLIEQLDDSNYAAKPNGNAGVGEHFRHNLDFANSLFKGIESGRVDYSGRERDVRVETDRNHATDCFEDLIDSLDRLESKEFDLKLSVRSEVDEELWLESSLARELEFLHSHTVHHYALIAAKLSLLGIPAPEGFGVAPSTLKYWNSKEKSFIAG